MVILTYLCKQKIFVQFKVIKRLNTYLKEQNVRFSLKRDKFWGDFWNESIITVKNDDISIILLG